MNDYERPEQSEDQLERCKRASLRIQVQRGVWHLDALVRRVEREAPEVHRRLRSAVEALQLLGAQMALEDEMEECQPTEVLPGEPLRVEPPKEAEQF